MTQKELLYLEDTLSHEKMLEQLCSNFSNEIKEEDIKNFIIYLENKYHTQFESLYGLFNI